MGITKNHLYNIIVGDWYEFQIFEIIDARQQKYYMGTPVKRGVTRNADTLEELRQQLEMQVEPLNKFAEMFQDDYIEPVINVVYDLEKYNEIDDRYFYHSKSKLSKQKKKTKKKKKSTERVCTQTRPNNVNTNRWVNNRCH